MQLKAPGLLIADLSYITGLTCMYAIQLFCACLVVKDELCIFYYAQEPLPS